MHSYYAFLALDVARERSLEAERTYFLRHGADGWRESSRIARRLADAVRGIRSMFDVSAPNGHARASGPQH
jgi:hypothetical protein